MVSATTLLSATGPLVGLGAFCGLAVKLLDQSWAHHAASPLLQHTIGEAHTILATEWPVLLANATFQS